MRRAILSVLVTVMTLTVPAWAQGERELFDPATGVAVNVPREWNFWVDGQHLLTADEDRRGIVFMAALDDFEDQMARIETLLGEFVFRDVKVNEATIMLGRDRGALEGAVVATGTGIDRGDGEAVEIAAMLVQSGNAGEIIIGAWKEAAAAETVMQIVDSVRVLQPTSGTGIELRDTSTGASMRLAEGWAAYTSKTGLLAYSPERDGMVIIVRSEQDFSEKASEIRTVLREKIFTDITIGEFAAATQVLGEGFGRVVAATGAATVRADGDRAEFLAIVGSRSEGDRGMLVVGAWKNVNRKEDIASMLKSMRLPAFAEVPTDR
ncbi:MAG: hypothetical protein ACYTGC_00690 [Planctomycetota bacterium]|jgi:hypothetical protein